MKIKFLSIFFLLLFVNLSFAAIPIYCPKCKVHLYDYQKEIIKGTQVKAEDFKPVNRQAGDRDIPQPQDGEEMVCPVCSAHLNGWEYWLKKQHYKSYSFAYQVVSFLTKDKDGKWVWLPEDMPMLDFNEGKQ